MVPHTDTVIDPRAVVIEPFDAVVADGTVLGPGGAQDFAVGAHLAWVHFREDVQEGHLRFDVTWVFARSYGEGES